MKNLFREREEILSAFRICSVMTQVSVFLENRFPQRILHWHVFGEIREGKEDPLIRMENIVRERSTSMRVKPLVMCFCFILLRCETESSSELSSPAVNAICILIVHNSVEISSNIERADEAC